MLLSVVIPTMWRSESFLDMLEMIVNCKHVDEIIIIDNEKESTPDHEVLNNSKIVFYKSNSNLFVNPSWNLGAKLAKNDLLCFCQDDIVFDTRVFEKTISLYETNHDVGVVGSLVSYAHEESYEDKYYEFYADGKIDFVSNRESDINKRPPSTGCGNLFFVKKCDWIHIPEKIKIFHGEVLLWNHYNEIKENYIITNFDIKTKWHTTWNYLHETQADSFSQIQNNDQVECEKMNFRF